MQRFLSIGLATLLSLALVMSIPGRASAIGTAQFDSCGVEAAAGSILPITTVNFHQYKVPSDRSAFANRDLEFLWSDSYAALFGRPLNVDRPQSTDNELDLLGVTICATPSTGLFGFPIPYVQLIYDYLRGPLLEFGRPQSVDNYNTNPEETMGFAMGQSLYGDFDRNHVDTYVFAPPFSGDPLWMGGGDYYGDGRHPNPNAARVYPMYPSAFLDADEDVTSGHPASLDSANAYRMNSIGILGPRPSQVGVGGATDWTGPVGLAARVFNHEFQHGVNGSNDGLTMPSRPTSEILSAVAEALSADYPEPPAFDVPYTWGLLRSGLNYQAYRSFASYLTYNFRGLDDTFAGRGDDLVWRWARSGDRSISTGLDQQLTNANCLECANKPYFSGLVGPTDRAFLLVHNWRVANYVNKLTLADGQYGYPPQFGFDPIVDLGSWQNIDPSEAAYDSVNIELEVRLDSSHLLREMSQAGRPTGLLNPENAHAVALAGYGSDYWVVRSDPSLWSANRDLVVRIMPEGRCPRRILVSAIAYSEQNLPGGQPDKLWRHPEWAQVAVAPKWVDTDPSDPDPLELVVPNFGQTHKAALIILSTGAHQDIAGSDYYDLPYRMNLGLRSAPFQTPNPVQVTSFTGSYSAELPTWSPAGNEIAFARADATSGPNQIYRAPSAGGTPSPLFPQPFDQFYPDWSPRGDWVSFDQATPGGGCDIWAVNLINGESRHLTSSANHEFAATFSPNGQHLVYLRVIPFAGYQLRRVSLIGIDELLVARTNATMRPPRWAPNGAKVYFAVAGTGSPDSLYAVDAIGPSQSVVTSIAELPPGVFSFDPPRGNGRWTRESTWQPLSCGAPSSVNYQRASVHVGPTGPAETIFSRPASNVTYPRWSWDGTRVAFSSSRPNPVVPANIFVGQLTYNHAPTFVGLVDQTLNAGVAFQMDVNATDPDGETVTYEVPEAFLPPGASFDLGLRRFTWPNPAPSGEHFVVFRALDPSGAVDHRVVRLTVQGGGGCPFADTRTIAGWREENSVLGRSLSGGFVLDPYRLRFAPDVGDGRIMLRLRENEHEYTTLDQVRLVAVDHASDLGAYAVGDRVFLGTRVPAHRVTTSLGRDITTLVSGTGGHYWGTPGETLLVQMVNPRAGVYGAGSTQDGGGGEGGMEGDPKEMEKVASSASRPDAPANASAVDATVLGSTGIVVEVPDGSGGWRRLTHYYPRQYRDEAVVDSMGLGECRLVFVGRHRLHFIGRYLHAATQAQPRALTLLAASHSRLGDARNAVVQEAGATTLLAPGRHTGPGVRSHGGAARHGARLLPALARGVQCRVPARSGARLAGRQAAAGPFCLAPESPQSVRADHDDSVRAAFSDRGAPGGLRPPRSQRCGSRDRIVARRLPFGGLGPARRSRDSGPTRSLPVSPDGGGILRDEEAAPFAIKAFGRPVPAVA